MIVIFKEFKMMAQYTYTACNDWICIIRISIFLEIYTVSVLGNIYVFNLLSNIS